MTVTPATVNVQSSSNYTFSFRAPKNGFNVGSLATLLVPSGWSAPQTNNPTAPGYVSVTPILSGSSATVQDVSGGGPWLLTIGFSTSQKQGGFNLAYQGGVAPTNGGVYSFTAATKQSGGALTVLRSGSPTVTVNNVLDSNTTTTVSSSLNPSVYGTWVTFTGVVSSVGSRVPTGTLTFKSGDLVLGTVTLNGQATATFSTNRLSVVDSPDSITATYSGDTNFNASVSGILSQEVDPAALAVSGLIAQSKIYDGGTVASLNVNAVSLGGVLAGDNVALDTTTAAANFADPNVGSQKTVSVAGLGLSGTDSGNYVIPVTTNLAADILAATLAVTANDTNRVFGAANPVFTASCSGFVAGETMAVLSGAPALATSATPSSPVAGGPYPITVSNGTLAASNYVFTFVPGRLTIIPGPGQAQRIISLTIQSDRSVSLSCGGAAGQAYVLQASSDLSAGSWTVISTNTTDVNGWMTCTDYSAANAPRRFYRTCLP